MATFLCLPFPFEEAEYDCGILVDVGGSISLLLTHFLFCIEALLIIIPETGPNNYGYNTTGIFILLGVSFIVNQAFRNTVSINPNR